MPACSRRLPPGRRDPKPKKGQPLAKLATHLEEARTHGTATTVQWYRGEHKTLRLLSGECLWHTPGWPPLAIRWVLVLDPTGTLDPEAFFTTDLTLPPVRVIEWFILRWSIEVTFAEVRRHLGIETQRQCAAKAIAAPRTSCWRCFPSSA
jgi:hypothetical protein